MIHDSMIQFALTRCIMVFTALLYFLRYCYREVFSRNQAIYSLLETYSRVLLHLTAIQVTVSP